MGIYEIVDIRWYEWGCNEIYTDIEYLGVFEMRNTRSAGALFMVGNMMIHQWMLLGLPYFFRQTHMGQG